MNAITPKADGLAISGNAEIYGVELGNAPERFGRDRRRGRLMHIVEVVPRMRPARRQLDMVGDEEPFEVRVSIDLEDVLEPRQMRRRTFHAPIRAVEVGSG